MISTRLLLDAKGREVGVISLFLLSHSDSSSGSGKSGPPNLDANFKLSKLSSNWPHLNGDDLTPILVICACEDFFKISSISDSSYFGLLSYLKLHSIAF